MTLAIHELLTSNEHLSKEIDDFLYRSRFPLVEGRDTTFVFRGAVDAVRLQHWCYGLSNGQSFIRIGQSDLWFTVLKLPIGSRIEYKIEVLRGNHGEWILDPLNPNFATDPFGANSVCFGPGYSPPEWCFAKSNVEGGTVEEHIMDSKAFGDSRRFLVYLPARYSEQRTYPVLVAHDGEDYLRFSELKNVLDNLIDSKRIPPIIAILSNPGARLVEYAASEPHAQHMVEELIPWVEERYSIGREPKDRWLMGASFGAVATIGTAWRFPGFFSGLILQSGSFVPTSTEIVQRGPEFEPVIHFLDGFRKLPGAPAKRIFVSCGLFETLIPGNREMVQILRQQGIQVRYIEAYDGHHWQNWRDRLKDGLVWLSSLV